MRIQETDRVLKESRINRHAASQHEPEGMMNRAWKMMSSLPQRLTQMFNRH
jgi:hypothetical protein